MPILNKPVAAKRKSRFIRELAIEYSIIFNEAFGFLMPSLFLTLKL